VDGLKQRIIGALVLISLAVIFVPMVFDEPHSERTSTNIRIPEEPPFPEVSTPNPPPSIYQNEHTAVDNSPPKTVSETPAYRLVEEPDTVAGPVARTEPVATVPESSESDSIEYTASLKGAWVVQLGSFGNTDNARRLRDEVRAKGYDSSLQDVVRGDTKMTRVFSGPFASKSDAETAKQALDKAFNLNSLVTTGDK